MTDPGYKEEQKLQAEWENGNPYRHQSCMIDIDELFGLWGALDGDLDDDGFGEPEYEPSVPQKPRIDPAVGVVCNRCKTRYLSWMNISMDTKSPEWVLVDKNLDAHVCP